MQSAPTPTPTPTPGSPPALLAVKRVAATLGVSAATVYKLCEKGLLPHVRVADHSIRVTEADLADFVAKRTTTTKRGYP